LIAFLIILRRTWNNFRFAETWIRAANGPLSDLLWIVKAAKASLLVLLFFSLVADLWQLVILFWLVGLGIVLRRLVERAQREEAFAY
jgi:hypothetical protein